VSYVLAIRADRLSPRFGPIVVLAALPLAALVLGLIAVRRRVRRRPHVMLLTAAFAELLWALCTLAVLGFAVVRHSG
jgi:hypothetical protein